MKLTMCKLVEENGKQYLEDYRIKTDSNRANFVKGNLNDLDVWLVKSQGLGDVLGSFGGVYEWNDKLSIVRYSGGYAIGKLKEDKQL